MFKELAQSERKSLSEKLGELMLIELEKKKDLAYA